MNNDALIAALDMDAVAAGRAYRTATGTPVIDPVDIRLPSHAGASART